MIQSNTSDDYVKPAALATMSTSNILSGRSYLAMPSTGIPQTYRANFSAVSGGTTKLTAVWTDGLPITSAVTLTATGGGSIPITITDQYGNTSTSSVVSGKAYGFPLSDQVSYIGFPSADTLKIAGTEKYNTDIALSSQGSVATASSQISGNPASAANAGLTAGYGNGWSSASGDTTPWLNIAFPGTEKINRIVIDTQSNGSVASSLRNYTVLVGLPCSPHICAFITEASIVGQFRNHEIQIAIPPTNAIWVEIDISEVNFGGYFGGGIPIWWSPTDPAGAFVHAFQVYAGSSGVGVVNGTNLTPLTTGG